MSRGLLVMFAGGDPWKVNATLQSGRPAQIADLGQAFHNAGQSTQEADKAFAEARRRFDAWIRDNGQHPITDSAEVQRTATALGLQASQLPKIAVDLKTSPRHWRRRKEPPTAGSTPWRVGCKLSTTGSARPTT
jgi:hypothetical protein